ncbi:MAG: hypothetical protein M1274_05580, partial [Actinobacteria bacterium]|nr:hypothetical protein [Actinomycetota bacterium]
MNAVITEPTTGRPARPPLSHGDSGLDWPKTIEESVLGSMLIMPKTVPIALEILKPSDFFLPSHGAMFATIQNLHDEDVVIDPFSVADRLKDDCPEDACDTNYLLFLTGLPTVASDIRHLAEILKRQALEREARKTSELYLSGAIGMGELHSTVADLLERGAPSCSPVITLSELLSSAPAEPEW